MNEPASLLRLIPKELPPHQSVRSNMKMKPITESVHPSQGSSSFDFQSISSGIFIGRFKDNFHKLSCEITLEEKNSFAPHLDEGKESYLQPTLVGNFPSIDVQLLQEWVCWDEYLHCMLLIKFQLKILEQLLLFCGNKDVTNLYLTFNTANLDYIEIYQRFIIAEEEIISAHGEQTQITTPSDFQTFDALINFMEQVDHKFRQTLWSEQRTNPIYRHYLKTEALI